MDNDKKIRMSHMFRAEELMDNYIRANIDDVVESQSEGEDLEEYVRRALEVRELDRDIAQKLWQRTLQ